MRPQPTIIDDLSKLRFKRCSGFNTSSTFRRPCSPSDRLQVYQRLDQTTNPADTITAQECSALYSEFHDSTSVSAARGQRSKCRERSSIHRQFVIKLGSSSGCPCWLRTLFPGRVLDAKHCETPCQVSVPGRHFGFTSYPTLPRGLGGGVDPTGPPAGVGEGTVSLVRVMSDGVGADDSPLL